MEAMTIFQGQLLLLSVDADIYTHLVRMKAFIAEGRLQILKDGTFSAWLMVPL